MDSDTYLNNDDIYSPDRLNEEKNELLVNDHDFDGFISNESNGTSEVRFFILRLLNQRFF